MWFLWFVQASIYSLMSQHCIWTRCNYEGLRGLLDEAPRPGFDSQWEQALFQIRLRPELSMYVVNVLPRGFFFLLPTPREVYIVAIALKTQSHSTPLQSSVTMWLDYFVEFHKKSFVSFWFWLNTFVRNPNWLGLSFNYTCTCKQNSEFRTSLCRISVVLPVI